MKSLIITETDFHDLERLRAYLESEGYTVNMVDSAQELATAPDVEESSASRFYDIVKMKDKLLEELESERVKNKKLLTELDLLSKQNTDHPGMIGKFLAIISHEIRTPVNSLQQAAKQLQADLSFFNNKDISKLTSILVEDSNRLSRTIDLMLHVSQLQSGTYTPKIEKFDIFHEVLAPMIAVKKTHAEKKGVRFIINSTTLNCEVTADKYSSIQIFSNLIDNSIAYTDKGIIEIDITRTTESRLQISIIDTGIGMDEEYLEEVFNLFSQESQGYTRKYEGIGLGLTAVKGFCDINNVEISIKSEKYAGTVVTLVFT